MPAQITNYQCPACTGPLQFDGATGKLACEFCGSSFPVAEIEALIAAGEITAEDPNALAMLYVSPVLTLIGICDRQPEREHECLDQLKRHVSLFFRMVHAKEA